jgi:hypothetical protein
LPLHEWHHVAGVFDGLKCRLYLDGVEAAQGSADFSDLDMPAEVTFKIGDGHCSTLDDGGVSFIGIVDELRLSRIARYVDNQAFSPPLRYALDDYTAELWHLDEGSGYMTFGENGVGAGTGNFLWTDGR